MVSPTAVLEIKSRSMTDFFLDQIEAKKTDLTTNSSGCAEVQLR
jgi:hypothetical protein